MNDVTREEFFKWLHTFPGGWEIVKDEHGETLIRFHYTEKED